MISINNVTLSFGKQVLFEDVVIKFTNGNCYGLIKLLTGEIDTTKGEIVIGKGERLAYLEQDHYKYDDNKVIDVVLKGNQKLYDIMMEKDKLYNNPAAAAKKQGGRYVVTGWGLVE